MARDGFDGLGKMRGGERNSSYIPKPHGETKPHESTEEQEKSDGGSDQIHNVHDHGDGTFHTEHPDGTREEHPDHLHMLAHLGHKVTDGDKHHIFHHDGYLRLIPTRLTRPGITRITENIIPPRKPKAHWTSSLVKKHRNRSTSMAEKRTRKAQHWAECNRAQRPRRMT